MNAKPIIKIADKIDSNELATLMRYVSMGMRGSINELYITQSVDDQQKGGRDIILAYINDDIAGYVMLNYHPKYAYFKAHNMPEIQDLNVLPQFRRNGIGKAMVKKCEAHAKSKGYKSMGIGVGVTPSYGSAQRLYAKMGYIPDGYGVTYDRKVISHGEFRAFDDDVSLMLEKPLK